MARTMSLPKSASRRDNLSTQKSLPEPLFSLPKSHMSFPKVGNTAILIPKKLTPAYQEELGPGDINRFLHSVLSHTQPFQKSPRLLKILCSHSV